MYNIFRFLLFTIVLLSCSGKDENVQPKVVPDRIVYVVGNVTFPEFEARLWKDGEVIPLENQENCYATSLYVSGNDVYVAGYEGDSYTGVYYAVYWKNGKLFRLTDGQNHAEANSIFVSGSDVYVGGGEFEPELYRVQNRIWKNGVEYGPVLGDPERNNQIKSIFVKDGNVYACWNEGEGFDGGYGVNAQYAVNSVVTEIVDTGSTHIESIFVDGHDVYVAGVVDDESVGQIAKYWKNGIAVNLAEDRWGNSIFVSEGDVYVSGSAQASQTVFWKNETETLITSTKGFSSDGFSIFVFKNDVYVAGYMNRKARYWVNNNKEVTLDPNTESLAFAIFVVPR